MIEGGAILFVFVVTVGIFLSSWIGARQLSDVNAVEQLDDLRQHRETMLQKTIRGEREGWDGVMMRQLADRIESVDREIARRVAAR